MLYKNLVRMVSIILAITIISAASLCVSATSTGTIGFPSIGSGSVGVISPSTGDTSSTEDDATPPTTDDTTPPTTDDTTPPSTGEETPIEPTAVSISANYFDNGDGTYNIVFSSLDILEELKDFNFTVTLTDAKITASAFSDRLKTGSFSILTVGDNSAKFIDGSTETYLSGKLTLCSITTDTLPADGKVAFTDFTATDKDGTEITFAPTLTLEEGPVVPELSDKEQAAYDLIIALPEASTLSFYDEDGKLADIDALKKQVDDTVEAYNDLSAAEKANVEEVLAYNMETSEGLTTLPPIVTAMENVTDTFCFADILSGVSEDDIINYRFMTAVYDDIKDSISGDGIPEDSKLAEELSAASAAIETAKTTISTKLAEADYDEKIDSVSKQLEVIKTLTSDKYYKDYLSALLEDSEALYEDMEENCTDKYRDYMLQELSEKITDVKATQNNVSSLPTVKVGSVTRGRNYTITISRGTTADSDATVEVEVYKASNLDKTIDTSSSKTFKASATSIKFTMAATSNKYPSNEKIVIKASYTIGGATYELESQTVNCGKEVPNMVTPGISYPSSSTPSSNTGNDDETPSGTVYPEVDDEPESKPTNPEDTELFSDISNYDWAKEAIEGLYYAGIINGMEEGIFNPAGNVTREQFCKMVVQLFGVLSYDSVSSFSDVDPNAWYAPYINSAVQSGYVQGQSDDYFGIGESIMRQDMAIILYRALGSQGSAAPLGFTDNDSIADYAREAISEFVGLGILNGYEDGSFKPRGTATRAEAAKIIWEVYKILNK